MKKLLLTDFVVVTLDLPPCPFGHPPKYKKHGIWGEEPRSSPKFDIFSSHLGALFEYAPRRLGGAIGKPQKPVELGKKIASIFKMLAIFL